jgi:hypothetical protein
MEIQIVLTVNTICQNEFGLHWTHSVHEMVGYGLPPRYVLQLVVQKLYALKW